MFKGWKRRRERSKGGKTAAEKNALLEADLPSISAGLAAKLCLLLDWLNTHALAEEGLHRVPGSSAELAILQKKIKSHDRDITTLLQVVDTYSTHTVAGVIRSTLLKSYEPVCSYSSCVDFEHSNGNTDVISKLVSLMSPVNSVLLQAIMRHLSLVAQHSNTNKMTPRNLATVWMPVLLRPSEKPLDQIGQINEKIGAVMTMIESYSKIWPLDAQDETVIEHDYHAEGNATSVSRHGSSILEESGMPVETEGKNNQTENLISDSNLKPGGTCTVEEPSSSDGSASRDTIESTGAPKEIGTKTTIAVETSPIYDADKLDHSEQKADGIPGDNETSKLNYENTKSDGDTSPVDQEKEHEGAVDGELDCDANAIPPCIESVPIEVALALDKTMSEDNKMIVASEDMSDSDDSGSGGRDNVENSRIMMWPQPTVVMSPVQSSSIAHEDTGRGTGDKSIGSPEKPTSKLASSPQPQILSPEKNEKAVFVDASTSTQSSMHDHYVSTASNTDVVAMDSVSTSTVRVEAFSTASNTDKVSTCNISTSTEVKTAKAQSTAQKSASVPKPSFPIHSALAAAFHEIQTLREQLSQSGARYVSAKKDLDKARHEHGKQIKSLKEEVARERALRGIALADFKRRFEDQVRNDRLEGERVAEQKLKIAEEKVRKSCEASYHKALGLAQMRHHEALHRMKERFQTMLNERAGHRWSAETAIRSQEAGDAE